MDDTASCVVTALERWRYPKHDGPAPLTVELPFELVPEDAQGCAPAPTLSR